MKTIIKRRSDWPCEYLTGIRYYCYGTKILACYDCNSHTAMPLTEDQARALLPMLREEFPPASFFEDSKNNVPRLCLSIVDYPARSAPELPDQEVPGNGSAAPEFPDEDVSDES